MASPTASSGTAGFFQALPTIPPAYTSPEHLQASANSIYRDPKQASDDTVLARILGLYLPAGAKDPVRTIHDLSRRVLDPDVLAHAVDAETNHPTLTSHGTFGAENKQDPLRTTAGWKALKVIAHE